MPLAWATTALDRSVLTTFSFQARGFYEKYGYCVAGAMEDYPPGATYFWMRKEFAPDVTSDAP